MIYGVVDCSKYGYRPLPSWPLQGVGKEQHPAAERVAEEKEKEAAAAGAVAQAQAVYGAPPPPPPPPRAMEIPSEKEVAMAHRESEEWAADAARHQWLDGLEKEGRKQRESALSKELQVKAASIGGGSPTAVTTRLPLPGGEAVAAERDGEGENRQRSREERIRRQDNGNVDSQAN